MNESEDNSTTEQAQDAVAGSASKDEFINGRRCLLVPLEEPIKREGGNITELRILKPLGGDLRGLSLQKLWDMDANSIQAILPRITVPTLVQHEAIALDVVDLMNCAAAVTDFLLPTSVRKHLQG